jgi:hypothetical protein
MSKASSRLPFPLWGGARGWRSTRLTADLDRGRAVALRQDNLDDPHPPPPPCKGEGFDGYPVFVDSGEAVGC